MLSEIESVVRATSHKLLQVSVPPVKYWLLVDTLGLDDSDPQVQRAVAECKAWRPRQKLIETLRPDGTWPISRSKRAAEEAGPGPPVGWTYITMLRNLQLLEDCSTDGSEGHVSAALEKILSWQQ